MDLALVDCFLRVAELGSINRAAEELDMTQPALSRRIAALEHDMGVHLLVRGARGVRLTEAGAKLVKGAGPILRLAGLLREEIGQQVHTQVSLGLPFSMHRLITAPFAASQVRKQAKVSLRVYEGFIHHLREWMQQGLIDVAILDSRDINPEFVEHTPLVREQLLLVGPSSAGLRADTPVDAQQLGACPLILPGRPNFIRQSVDSHLKRHGQRFRRAADAETLPLCLSLAKEGLGFTAMPYCALHENPSMESLTAAPIDGLFVTWSLNVSQARRHAASVRQIASQLKRTMLDRVREGGWPFAEAIAPD
jgi:LysR family nitrogen assimilation transcriptional regulator